MLPEGAEGRNARARTDHDDGHVPLPGQAEVGRSANEAVHILTHGNALEEGAADAVVGGTGGGGVLHHCHRQVELTGGVGERLNSMRRWSSSFAELVDRPVQIWRERGNQKNVVEECSGDV